MCHPRNHVPGSFLCTAGGVPRSRGVVVGQAVPRSRLPEGSLWERTPDVGGAAEIQARGRNQRVWSGELKVVSAPQTVSTRGGRGGSVGVRFQHHGQRHEPRLKDTAVTVCPLQGAGRRGSGFSPAYDLHPPWLRHSAAPETSADGRDHWGKTRNITVEYSLKRVWNVTFR